jgi:hypothetical protein
LLEVELALGVMEEVVEQGVILLHFLEEQN